MDLTSITFRCWLGATSHDWWQRNGSENCVIVLGHTGLADTTLLEFSQQSSQCLTVHAVHGISDGYNFSGRSNLALFRSVHDANWHRKLGGYGECAADVAVPVDYSSGERGVLLLTNYFHPMSRSKKDSGLEEEAGVLRMVSDCTFRSPQLQGKALHWRPHPSFDTASPALRERLQGVADGLGFARLRGKLRGEDLCAAQIVITTPSTAAIDALLEGALPVILDLHNATGGTIYDNFPLLARNAEELLTAIASINCVDRAPGLYLEAWNRVGPCKPLSLSFITEKTRALRI